MVLRLLESLTVVPSEGGEDGMGAETFANIPCISLVAVSASLTGPSVPAAEGFCWVGRTVADATVL